MGSKPAITRDQILDVAYARAQRDGMASLGIRTVANECGVAVGTIYNYFPDKASLVTEVVGRFWRAALEPARELSIGGAAEGPGCLIVYCRSLATSLCDSLSSFRSGWLREISTLDTRTRVRSHEAESTMLRVIRDGIVSMIQRDPGITAEARARFDADDLGAFIWRSLFDSIKAGDPSCSTLISLLELALYR